MSLLHADMTLLEYIKNYKHQRGKKLSTGEDYHLLKIDFRDDKSSNLLYVNNSQLSAIGDEEELWDQCSKLDVVNLLNNII